MPSSTSKRVLALAQIRSRSAGESDRNGRGRRLPERLADALAGTCGVRVPVQLADKLAAVLVPEVQCDVTGVEAEHVPGVQALVLIERNSPI